MKGIRVKLRLDFSGQVKKGKLFGSKNHEQLAEENRQHKVSLIRNVPIQGIDIEDIDMSQEIYAVIDDITGEAVSYAPVVITFKADSIEDAIKFSMKEEFRTVQVLEPEEILLSRADLERLLFRVSEELTDYKGYLLRKIDNWK